MFYPSEKEFIKLAGSSNIIAVYKEIMADIETPISAYLKLDNGKFSYLLESVEGAEKIARFSFLGNDPLVVFKSKKKKVYITEYEADGSLKKRIFDADLSPLAELKKLMMNFKSHEVKGLPRFPGGFVGYIGYDTVRFFEPKLSKNMPKDDLKMADMYFILAKNIIIFDHARHRLKIMVNAYIKPHTKPSVKNLKNIYRLTCERIDELERSLRMDIPLKSMPKQTNRHLKFKSNLGRAVFKKMVYKAKEYIKAGEIIQVVLSQRFSASLSGSHFDIYRRLRSINPSPYMFYLNFDDIALAGSSPEMFVRCENSVVQMRPIAGTRPRGRNKSEDLKLSQDLLADKKERAEHLMLVDLGRNDLGRVCKFGSVEVDEFMTVERYSHVMHIVSNVKGRLNSGRSVFDIVPATFPAGTVSGAPKVRAMEIIDELENVSRGPYAGCVGYFSLSGNLDTCITIRTVVMKGKTAYIQAGAGIVADSEPEKEYLETVNKAKAQMETLT